MSTAMKSLTQHSIGQIALVLQVTGNEEEIQEPLDLPMKARPHVKKWTPTSPHNLLPSCFAATICSHAHYKGQTGAFVSARKSSQLKE